MTAPALQLSPLGKAAIGYVERLHWAVFPLHHPVGAACSCANAACESIGKHPRTSDGFKSASNNPEQVRRWWTQWPDANIGIATGTVSGIVVIDLDGPIAEDVFGAHYGNPPTPCSLTGRGRHLVFQHPGTVVPNSSGKLGAQIDVRGDGGYIVAPPSLHVSGRVYAWDLEHGMHPVHLPPAPLPARLREDIGAVIGGARLREGGILAFPASEIPNLERIPDGERNDTLARYAGRLLAKDHTPAETFELVMALNQAKAKPPLSADEVRLIVGSLAKREAAKPARVTSTGNTLTVAEPIAVVAPTPRMMAEQQIVAGIKAGQRDGSADPRWAFTDLDELVGPMVPGRLWIVGSLPGNGKTSALFSQMAALADRGLSVVYLPLEMDPDELRRKLAAWRLGLNTEAVLQNEWHKLRPGAREEHEAEMWAQVDTPIHFPPDRQVTIPALAEWMRWGVREVGAKLIVIDHFHRMDVGGGAGGNYRIAVNQAVKTMKDLAREHGLPVIAASQLNDDGDLLDRYFPPALRRLKESKALGEEADVVLMLSRKLSGAVGRDDMLLIKSGAKGEHDFAMPNVMQVTCRKHRHRDSAVDRSVLLSVANGRVGNFARSWQREPGEE